MKFEITGKNGLSVTEAMKSHAEAKVERFEEFFQNREDLDVRVVCKSYKEYKKAEITLLVKGVTLRAEVQDEDMYKAIDLGVETVVEQIKKHFGQMKQKFAKSGIKDALNEDIDVDGLGKQLLAKELVKNKKIKLDPLTVEEAITEMEMLGHDFFVFVNSETEKVNVVYLRNDFDYAVIETE